MELNLRGKSARITGSPLGIGLGAACVPASEGVNIHLTSCTAADLEATKVA
jgi:short-subunit dehydrogenase